MKTISKVFMLMDHSHSKRMKNWSEGQVLFSCENSMSDSVWWADEPTLCTLVIRATWSSLLHHPSSFRLLLSRGNFPSIPINTRPD